MTAPIGDPYDGVVRLFSYGTLQQPEVQRTLFGRELSGSTDRLPGYRLSMLAITDPDVIATSGADRHPIVHGTGEAADNVEGTVFEITEADLHTADDYEVDDYTRALARLASGRHAWVYAASHPAPSRHTA